MPMLLILAVAMTPQQAAFRALADQDLRVATVGDALARGGADGLCAGHVSMSGVVVQDTAQYAVADRADARAALGLAEGPTVVGIVAGSAADRASLRPGDAIVSVDSKPVDASVIKDRYARIAQVEMLIDAGASQIVVRRSGGEVAISLVTEPGCPTRFQVVTGGGLNASADGRYVQITTRMLAFAANDDELAAVLAHELAHNVLRHLALKTPSRIAETQADRLSVWLVARAGYDVDAIVPFWTRLGRRTDYGIFSDRSHPGWKKRVAALETSVAEVKAQRAAGVSLVPPRTPAQ